VNSLTVTFADGTEKVVTPTPGDLVRFERQFDMGAEELGDSPRLEHIMFLAWAGLKRQGDFEGDFEAFLDGVSGADSADPKEAE